MDDRVSAYVDDAALARPVRASLVPSQLMTAQEGGTQGQTPGTRALSRGKQRLEP